MKIGADYDRLGTCRFVVWAPALQEMVLKIVSPRERRIPMERIAGGYWEAVVADLPLETQYLYVLDGDRERPDPASHFQPHGVHGPSQVVSHRRFVWSDGAWTGLNLAEMILYELHVGTFTPGGTLDAIVPRLDDLKDLGLNAIEIMPVGQFSGERNWGYDAVYPFAVQNSYGGPEALKRLVDACHQRGMAVILDVVFNHLGPEGNYLWDYGPYFTDRYRTPWGDAVNFDGAYSDEVRNFFIENALHWFTHYHIDGLRLDAVHAIHDRNATPFLLELAERVKGLSENLKRPCCLIAESDLNDARIVRPPELGGCGLDAVWCDDFHHALHGLLTGENHGYYEDFGRVSHLLKAMSEGFVYSGEYSAYRRHRHGNSSADRPGRQFVVFSQNHDQVGNRMLGERLAGLLDFEGLKLCAGLVLLSPYVPLLFMGEEYGEETPFLYFVSHSDKDLIEAVRRGRRQEFASFKWLGEPPDPQSVQTFLASKLRWEKRMEGRHPVLLAFYKALIKLRLETPSLSNADKSRLETSGRENERCLLVERWEGADSNRVLSFFNLNEEDVHLETGSRVSVSTWKKKLDSSETIWGGPGSVLPDRIDSKYPINLRARSFAVYVEEGT